jgi:16S rRNA processing protein RimM
MTDGMTDGMTHVTASAMSVATDIATDTATQDWLQIGRIVGAHGLNGHVKVYAESDFPERFTKPGDRWLQKPNGEPMLVRITSGRFLEGTKHYLVKLAGIDHRDQAEDLRQAQMMVLASDRLSLAPDEFHVGDLIGLSVVLHREQSVLGTVTDIFTMGHDMLEVTIAPSAAENAGDEAAAVKPVADALHPSTRAKAAQKLKLQARKQNKQKKPKTLLIPFVEEIVPVVDIAAGRIEITPPPGLLDL